VVRALKAGARAYLLKRQVHRELLETIRAVHAGQRRIPQEMAAELVDCARDDLTPREVDVLRLIANGNANKAAITALDSERSTMQDMMQQAKLQVINLTETWKHSSAEQRQEMVRAFFPAGIWYSQQMTYFKPRNSKILQLFANYLQDESLVGVPDGI